MLTLEELKELIANRIDPDELVELLDINTEELTEAFEEYIIARRERIEEYLEIEE